jgi:hypothetical protein
LCVAVEKLSPASAIRRLMRFPVDQFVIPETASPKNP